MPEITTTATAATFSFIVKNFDKVLGLANKTYAVFDEKLQDALGLTYAKYLTQIKDKYSRAKSFFIRGQSVDLYDYYVPISLSCGNIYVEEPSIDQLLRHSRHIVITGAGGCGKSVLMRHLLLDSIQTGDYVPILIELRDLNENEISLDSLLLETLSKFGFDLSDKFIEKAKTKGHFLFLLDGYDEVNYSLRKKLITDIKKIISKYLDCPIIISSRPDNIFNGIDELYIFNIKPLSLKSATLLVAKLPFDLDIKQKFTKALKKDLFEKHESFLSNPLLLSIMLLTYGENAEIPKKLSVFYEQAYEALFQKHDANKGGYTRVRLTSLDIRDFSRVFSLFSLQAYDKRSFRISKSTCINYIEKSKSAMQMDFKADDYLTDLLSATCLLIEDGLDIIYTHRSFQEYFVALYISNAVSEIQQKLIDKYSESIGYDNVISLLFEINPDIVERYYLIPKLGSIFAKISVTKKIGKTHALKYLKLIARSIEVSEEGLAIYFPDGKGRLNAPVNFVQNHIINTPALNSTTPSDFYDQMIQKYYQTDTVNRTCEFVLSELNLRSPIIKDILNSGEWLSIKYLQNIFDIYLKIKKKHTTKEKDLEELLEWK